jgi:hypothetical protein
MKTRQKRNYQPITDIENIQDLPFLWICYQNLALLPNIYGGAANR